MRMRFCGVAAALSEQASLRMGAARRVRMRLPPSPIPPRSRARHPRRARFPTRLIFSSRTCCRLYARPTRCPSRLQKEEGASRGGGVVLSSGGAMTPAAAAIASTARPAPGSTGGRVAPALAGDADGGAGFLKANMVRIGLGWARSHLFAAAFSLQSKCCGPLACTIQIEASPTVDGRLQCERCGGTEVQGVGR